MAFAFEPIDLKVRDKIVLDQGKFFFDAIGHGALALALLPLAARAGRPLKSRSSIFCLTEAAAGRRFALDFTHSLHVSAHPLGDS